MAPRNKRKAAAAAAGPSNRPTRTPKPSRRTRDIEAAAAAATAQLQREQAPPPRSAQSPVPDDEDEVDAQDEEEAENAVRKRPQYKYRLLFKINDRNKLNAPLLWTDAHVAIDRGHPLEQTLKEYVIRWYRSWHSNKRDKANWIFDKYLIRLIAVYDNLVVSRAHTVELNSED